MKRQTTFKENNSKLYLIATPIGNLKDITYRAVETLNMVDYIYCEDTRTSQKLLNHYNIKKPLRSVHLFNENEISQSIINEIKNGKNIGIISDAGLPIISDPGWIVVHDAIENDIDVVVIPGVSAGISALIASGISASKYLFVGFLNSKRAKRKEELKKLSTIEDTIVMYESPHRIEETLKILDEVYKERNICLARELTKLHEEYLRGTAKELLEVIDTIKGEIVLIIDGCKEKVKENPLNKLSLSKHYDYYIEEGFTSKEALIKISEDTGLNKNDIYNQLKK